MNHLLKSIAFLAACLLSAVAISAQATTPGVAITLERGACFGTCPMYSLTIYDDGTVVYNGDRFVEATGEQTWQMDPETVTAMVDAFAEAGYFEWDAEYTDMSVTDLPYIVTSVTRDGETHSINHYTGDHSAPLALSFLEAWIDQMVNTAQWTGVPTDVGMISNGSDTPLVTLEQTPCFGMCPVYQVALYADGTVVVMGIAHTDHFGVHLFETEPDAVVSLAERADLIGYFDWQDNYNTILRTDQSTLITSLRNGEQYKRISHYLSDPNAPVGLGWVEDDITNLVNSVAQ
jgi:hypothetical protein